MHPRAGRRGADSGDPARRAELAAEAETGLDFTAIYDGDVRRCAPLHVNCGLVLYARAIARVAAELGREEEARRWSAEADSRAERVRDHVLNQLFLVARH